MSYQDKISRPLIRFLRQIMRPNLSGRQEDFVLGITKMQNYLQKHVQETQATGLEKYFYNEDSIRDMAPHERLLGVYEHLEYQVRDLLTHLYNVENLKRGKKHVCSATNKNHTYDYPGFHLRTIQHSKAPAGGEGVFVEGVIQEGCVVGFFPGLVFKDYEVWAVNYGTDDISDVLDPMLHHRHDAYVIDGATNIQAWRQTVEGGHALTHPDLSLSQECGTAENAYALMQHVPHPPKDEHPNVLALPFNVEQNVFDEKIIPYIPNQFFPEKENLQEVHIDARYGDDTESLVMKMIVFVATRRIENEELFIDYRLDPDSPCPEWYHVVNEKALRKFLGKTGIKGRVKSWWRRRQARRWEIYKQVMQERRGKHLDDLPEALGGKPEGSL